MPVPYHRQIDDASCGPAVLQMVFEYFGKKIPQEQLFRELRTSEAHGTTPEALIEVARANGFHCQAKDGASVEEIRQFLEQGLPVIVNFIEPAHGEGHYAIVTDYQDGQLIFNDPWNGQDFRLAETAFVDRWHDSKNLHRRWLMVISREDQRR